MTMRSDSGLRPTAPGDGRLVPVGESEPALKAIVADLWHNSERLVQQELQLAVVELEARVEKAKLALRQAAIAGGLFHAAYLTTLATVVLLLSEVMASWLAALLVAIVASAGAYAFARRSKKAAHEVGQPETHEPIPSSRRTVHS